MDNPKLISLFTGCGGLDLGFEEAGFNIKVAVEKEEWACETLRQNFKNTVVIGPPSHSGDVYLVSGNQLLEAGGLGDEGVDLVIGGPPCQSFSIAAAQRFLKADAKYKRTGFGDRRRGNLVFEFFRLVSEISPRNFLIENVPGFVDLDNGETATDLCGAFRAIGYHTSAPFLANSVDYGVPQNRMRIFIIGTKACKDPTFPAPTYFPSKNLVGRPTYMTVAHALWAMPRTLPNHVPRNHKPESLKRYKRLQFGEREPLGRVDRLDPRKPSKTVIAGGSMGGGRSHLHPYLARTLTVRECARLQSFPDDFVFSGSMARQFTQVGNAVPPLLAFRIARHILATLLGVESNDESRLERMYPDSMPTSELCLELLKSARTCDAPLLYDIPDNLDMAFSPSKVENTERGGKRNRRFSKRETIADNGIHTLEEYHV